MTNNNQLQHTDSAHWVTAMAKALGSIEKMAERQDNMIAETKEYMLDSQKHLAKELARDHEGRWGNPEKVAAEDIRRCQERMEEYQRNIEHHEILRDAYRMAAAIIAAATGEYFYAALDGYYGKKLMKFSTEERRDAWIEEAGGSWHAATDADLETLFWGQTMPEEEPTKF